MSEHWAKQQLIDAHRMLTVMGVPDRETRPDPRSPTADPMEFSLSVPERLQWVRREWAPKTEKK